MADDPAAPTPPSEQTYIGSWTIRRRIVVATLVYCGICEGWLVFFATDNVLHQQLAYALAGLAAMVIGSYVFGAAWDDHSIRRFQQGGQ